MSPFCSLRLARVPDSSEEPRVYSGEERSCHPHLLLGPFWCFVLVEMAGTKELPEHRDRSHLRIREEADESVTCPPLEKTPFLPGYPPG